MADPELPLTGQDTPIKVFLGNQPFGVSDTIDSWSVTEDAVIHKDQYMGRQRHRLDKQLNGYDMSISSDMTNTTLLAALIAQQAARDANQPIPELAVEVQARQRNGLVKSFMLVKGVGKTDIKGGGRTERIKQGLDLNFEDLLPVAL